MVDKLVVKNPVVLVNNTALGAEDGTNISAYVESCVINANIEEQDGTAYGSVAKESEAGLEDNTIQLNLFEAAAMSALDGVLWALRGTKVFVSVKQKDEAVGANNPSYRGKVLVAGAYPIGGSVGQIAKKSLTWRIQTAITRAVA